MMEISKKQVFGTGKLRAGMTFWQSLLGGRDGGTWNRDRNVLKDQESRDGETMKRVKGIV